MNIQERFRGCLLGLAAGDAVGTTVEFRARGSFRPVTDMTGGGPFGLKAGQWTDDTSMALCLATSLLERGGFDADDQMRRYCDWHENGYMSSNGRCFDIGNTCRQALEAYCSSGEPFSGSTHTHSAGNGAIMRLAPAPMFYFPDLDQAVHYAAESSRTTHGALECLDACRLFAAILVRALRGDDKESVLLGGLPAEIRSDSIRRIGQGKYRNKTAGSIRGGGYVVDSLEAALWCFDQTDSFEAAILQAANLGDDADTTAAVCGQVAGAFYGEGGIPLKWRDKLAEQALIVRLADELCAAGKVD